MGQSELEPVEMLVEPEFATTPVCQKPNSGSTQERSKP
jgi:hypothetical protein